MTSKYFKPAEMACSCCGKEYFSPFLLAILDMVRARYGKPMVVTSGYRCPKHNKAVGGVRDSAHVKGLAVDIACDNTADRFNLVKWFLAEGIERIGVYQKKGFIHVDVDASKPRRRMW